MTERGSRFRRTSAYCGEEMPKHSLRPGQAVIEGLVDLGRALGYAAKTEFAVSSDSKNPPAVDVAWLQEEDQRFPLMIFEVESRASSSVANNAQKVFAQETRHFEKPLFFFHVFLKGRSSSRLKTLEVQYGTYNYRHYSLDAGDFTRLILDVLHQHRRLTASLDIPSLLGVLSADPWQAVDQSATLKAIESAEYSIPYSSVYAGLCLQHDWIHPHFLHRIAANPYEGEYSSYIGSHWRVPVHLALLAHCQPSAGSTALQGIIDWQETSSYMTQIGPHFGLSHDYDHFILGFAPTLWALIAALMLDVPGACAYIAKQNHSVLHALSGAELFYSALTALWLLHLAAVGNIPESFELARNHINDRGGINSKLLHYPPGYFNLEEPSKTPWVYELEDNAGDVPSFEDFRTTFLSQQWIARFNLFRQRYTCSSKILIIVCLEPHCLAIYMVAVADARGESGAESGGCVNTSR